MLLERDRPLALLGDALAGARRGDGRVVLIGGEAGVGKTSLVERFAAQARDERARVLWGACEALSTPHPLGPLFDIAREARGPLKALLASGDRPALFAAVLDELAAPPAPVVVVVEDIHWADAATLDLVRHLGRRIHRVPALLILTYRDDATSGLQALFGQLPTKQVARIGLEPLSREAVRTLAAGAARDDAGLHATTGGNPFFVTEVLAHAADRLPATVRDAVVARAAALDPTARAVLDLAAVVPRSIEQAVVARIIPTSADAIDACLASGLLQADGDLLRFRHELARVAIESSLSASTARRLHAAVLAALLDLRPDALARIVHHADGAGDDAAVARFAPAAAREAAARGARREAAAHCRLAFAQDGLQDAERAALLDDYAGHCFELNDLACAIPARDEAIALFDRLGDRPRQVAALAAQALQLVRALRNADADAASRRAIALVDALPTDADRARVYAVEAYLRMLNRDGRDAVAWGERAIALAEPLDDRATLAAATRSVGAALLFVDHARGVATLARSLALAHDLDDGGVAVADAYVMLGTGSGEVHRFDVAEGHLADGIAFARAHDLDRLAGYMEAWQALVDVYRGRWTLAGTRANAVVARETTGSTNRVMALVALARLRTRRGDPGVDAALDEALDLAAQSGTLQRIAPVRAARAEAAWLAGDRDRVRHEASAVFDLAVAKSHPWFVGELAFWLWRADALPTRPEGCATPYALQIDGAWAAAAAAWEALGCPYEQARALADGDENAQRRSLVLFDRLGATPIGERVRQTLRAAGARAVPRGPRASTRGNAAGLTTRELEILAMLADGWPNARIAAALSRSSRTVEHHVAAILEKLGAASRADAVAIARRRRLLSQDG